MSLSQAQKFFEQKNYSATIDECVKLMKDNKNLREACTLSAKATLYVLGSPESVNNSDTFFTSAKSAILQCKTVKEIYETSYEIRYAIEEWHTFVIENALSEVENAPSIEALRDYINVKPEYAKTKILIFMALVHPNRQEMLEKEGITAEEAEKLYYEEVPTLLDEIGISKMEFASAQRIFATVQNYIDSNVGVYADIAEQVANNATNALLMLDNMINFATPDKTSKSFRKGDMLSFLHFHAEVLTYLMETQIYVNEQPISIYMGYRENTNDTLRNLYERIQTLDNNFIPPTLPNVHPVRPASASSSGGCYVATAVYGSYDCPQVWTLRRYRDNQLAKSRHGRAFIRIYYAISPTLVKWFGETKWFKRIWLIKLDKMVNNLQLRGFEATPYEDKQW